MNIGPVILLLIFFLPVQASGFSSDDCYSCHYQKAMRVSVKKSIYEQSVHGRFRCTACHTTVSRYPHGKVYTVSCIICHFTGDRGAPMVREFKFSVHGKALQDGKEGAPNCQDCHGSHYIFPSKDVRSDTARNKIPGLCSRCHAAEYKEYASSIHGKKFIEMKDEKAATCFDCHMEHQTPAVNEEGWKLSLIKECGNCHHEEMSTYRKTFHGKVTRLGYTTVAKCSDCHGSHRILQVKDKNSMLSESNIVATCKGVNCHPDATARFTKFYAHAEESNRAKYPLLFYTYIFMTTLLLGVFTFFFIHTFLWAYRALKERMAGRKGKD